MRIAIKGTSGSGKTTLGQRLSRVLEIPHIELDALNWEPGWRDLSHEDLDEFRRRVQTATSGPEWVICGSYSSVDDLILGSATHLVWLDYGRPRVMVQVITRSVARAISGQELWPGTGNREDFRRWPDPDHPIRWAWNTHARRRAEIPPKLQRPEFRQLELEHLRTPRDARRLLERLQRECFRPAPAAGARGPGPGP